jgi:hypothetical protein
VSRQPSRIERFWIVVSDFIWHFTVGATLDMVLELLPTVFFTLKPVVYLPVFLICVKDFWCWDALHQSSRTRKLVILYFYPWVLLSVALPQILEMQWWSNRRENKSTDINIPVSVDVWPSTPESMKAMIILSTLCCNRISNVIFIKSILSISPIFLENSIL